MKATEQTIKDLELLLEFASAEQLIKDINFLLFKFLIFNDPDCPPENAKEFYENIYFLLDFLGKVQAEKNAEIVAQS